MRWVLKCPSSLWLNVHTILWTPCHSYNTMFHHSLLYHSALTCFSIHSSVMFSELWKCDIGILFNNHLCSSWLATSLQSNGIHYKEKLLWLRLMMRLIYGYKHQYFKGSLITSSFSGTNVVGLPYCFWPPQAWAFDQIHHILYTLPSKKLVSDPIRNQLITSLTAMPLLHRKANLALKVAIITCRV